MITAKRFTRKVFENIKSNWFLPVTEYQVYSTSETKCGVWTDGKPIYRKIITGKTPASNNTTVTLMSSGVEHVINCCGYIVETAGVYQATVPYNYRAEQQFAVYMQNDAVVMDAKTQFPNQLNADFVIALDYTKVNDTASSSKVPFEPLHEWSLEEKLVGYWIDGSPVYEKTVTGVTAKGESEIMTGLTGIMIGAEGFVTMNGWQQVVSMAHSTSADINIYAGSGKVRLSMASNATSYVGETYYITLRYTK